MYPSRFLLFLTFWSNGWGRDDNFFIAKKNNSRYVCVTNSSFALSAISTNLKQPLQQASQFIPIQPPNEFDCEISFGDNKTTQYYTKKPWSLIKSLESNTSDVIFDRRWEDMKTEVTTFVEGSGELEYKTILTNLKENFEIPLSIRTDKEAHIFLCDGPSPPLSNCYWILLQAFGGIMSAITKCSKGRIPTCGKQLANIAYNLTKLHSTDHLASPKILSSTQWSHFKLTKTGNDLSFVEYSDTKKDMLLELADRIKTIQVTHMIIHSKTVNALWKLHQLEYIQTKEEAEVILGPPVYAIKGTVCISMFVTMCEHCKLKLALKARNQTVKEETYQKSTGWSKIRFFIDQVQDEEFNLAVSTNSSSHNRFWAIDKVRQCQTKEFRKIDLDEFDSCQLMSTKNNLISFEKKLVSTENNCPRDTVGEYCVPCTWIYENCNQITICSKYLNLETRCLRSARFADCPKGYYGDGCRKKCGNCYNDHCDSINGTCHTCVGAYIGPKCDTLLEPLPAPWGIETIWTTNNDLHLEWQYQNISDNATQHFKIVMIPLSNQNKEIIKQVLPYTGKSNYRCRIAASQLVPSTTYEITVGVYSRYTNNKIVKLDSSPPETPELSQNPHTFSTEYTITVEISPKQSGNVHDILELILLISDDNSNKQTSFENFDLGKLRTVCICQLVDFNRTYSVTIGDERPIMENCGQNFGNPPLDPGTAYNITVILRNSFKNKTRSKIYSLEVSTVELGTAAYYLVPAIGFPLIIVIASIIFLLSRKRKGIFYSGLENPNYSTAPVSYENEQVSIMCQNNGSMSIVCDNYVSNSTISKIVPFATFNEYVRNCLQNGEFQRQHSAILNSPSRTYEDMNGNQYFEYIDMVYIEVLRKSSEMYCL